MNRFRPFQLGNQDRNIGIVEDLSRTIPNSRHKAVLHFRDKDEFVVFVNAYEQCVKPVGTRNVTTNDEILLSIRAELDPGT
jgi:hypothetical protein